MIVTQINIEFPNHAGDTGRLRAYVKLVFDDVFCVKGLRIIDGHNGLFLQMPDRPALTSCPACRGKADVSARFCPWCGNPIPAAPPPEEGRQRHRHDIAHPIRADLREHIESMVMEAYHARLGQATKEVAG